MPGRLFDFHARLAPVPGAADRLRATLDECGIGRAALAAGGTIDPDRLSRQLVDGGHVTTDPDNDVVLAECERSAGRFVPFYFANPHRPAARYRHRSAEFRGLEISPAVHGVPLTDPRVAGLVQVAADAGHPVYVVCLARPGSAVTDLVRLAERFREVTFVLGHCGVGLIDLHAVNLVAPLPNLLLETSGGFTSVLTAALARLGPQRLLFGSEPPLQHPSVELAKFRAIDIDDEQWDQIAWRNPHRVLGLEVPA